MNQLLENLLTVLTTANHALTRSELTQALNLNAKSDYEQVLAWLAILVHHHLVKVYPNETYILTKKWPLRVGTFASTSKSYGFIHTSANESYFVASKNTLQALNKDLVIFKIIPPFKKTPDAKPEALVLAVMNRDRDLLVGRVEARPYNKWVLVPITPRFNNYEITIINNQQLTDNSIIVAKIVKVDLPVIIVSWMRTLGQANDPSADILALIYDYGIKPEFDPATIKAATALPNDVDLAEAAKRTDLTNELLVTIDGETAKDFDDAICVYKQKDNTYRLIVAIADVAHYVRANQPLDKEALLRGTSVYLIDRVIPMLPPKLSNGICSLNPDALRLCMVCDLNIDHQGNVLSANIYEAKMKSKARLTYKEVNAAFTNGSSSDLATTKPKIYQMLLAAKELYQILNKKQLAAGMIDFDLAEPEIIVDDHGKVIDIRIKERGVSERLIEAFMIKANSAIAKAIATKHLPFIYRVHDRIPSDKLDELLTIIKVFGYPLSKLPAAAKSSTTKKSTSHTKHQPPKSASHFSPKTIADIIDYFHDDQDFNSIADLILRTMAKAEYSPHCTGHFGLALKYYTHFTSPIRRYPDLLVHRLLKLYICHPQANVPDYRPFIQHAAQLSNANEIKAVSCERAVNKMAEADFMSDKIGAEFMGHIAAITNFGMFVELNNTVEGLVRFNDLDDDYYEYLPEQLQAVGKFNHHTYKLGQRVKIKVKTATKLALKIDFELIEPRYQAPISASSKSTTSSKS